MSDCQHAPHMNPRNAGQCVKCGTYIEDWSQMPQATTDWTPRGVPAKESPRVAHVVRFLRCFDRLVS